MTAGFTRLGRCCVPVILGLSLSCGAALAQQPAAASRPTAAQAAAAAVSLEVEIGSLLKVLPTLSASETVQKLTDLLASQSSGVASSVQIAAYNALGAAYERLAQEARADRMNPAAERNAQKYIDNAVESYVKAGTIANTASDVASAGEAFARALSYRPDNTEALLGTARVYAATGRAMQAIEKYQDYFRATGKGPLAAFPPALYIEIGRVYLASNLWHQAMKCFNDAKKNGGDTDDVAALMGEAYLGLNRIDEALAQIQVAISKNPTQPVYYSRYAQILLAQKQLPQAAEQARASIKIARVRLRAVPDDLDALKVMGQCYDVYIRVLQSMAASGTESAQVRLDLVQAMQELADVNQLLALHRALNVIRMAPERDRRTVSMLETEAKLEWAVQHRDLAHTCELLLTIDPNNKIAKDIQARLIAAPTASAPAGAGASLR